MEKHLLTEKELADTQCNDISIRSLPNGKDFLILMCNQKQSSVKLRDILSSHAFDLRATIDQMTGNYSLDFHFIDSEIGFTLNTGKNEVTYPPLSKFKNNQIKYITTGIWTGLTDQGKTFELNTPLIRLGIVDIGDSFSQASGVQFIVGETENSPSVVVLTYRDYDHIYEVEANEAYNKLMEMPKNRPLLEISFTSLKTINLRIWDILVDLDINFDGLEYSNDQLNKFLNKTGENQSFAFAIGFLPQGNEKAALAATKQGSFDLITLFGYTLIKDEIV